MTERSNKRLRLPVLRDDAFPPCIVRDHKTGEIKRTKSGKLSIRDEAPPRYSDDTTRAIVIEVEPQPYEAADGPACDVESYRRYIRWRAANALRGTWTPLQAPLPATRADCPPDRHEVGCGHPRCRHFLWRVEEPAGRPGLRNVPRDPVTGFTLRVKGDLGPRAAPQIVPRWLESGKLPPSCALDVADEGPLDNSSLGEIIGKHRTLTARLVKRAVQHMRELGETARDLERLIDSHRAAANDHEAEPSKRRGRG